MKIKTVYDPEAKVWIATSPDVPGLILEGPSKEKLVQRAQDAAQELIGFAGSLPQQQYQRPVQLREMYA